MIPPSDSSRDIHCTNHEQNQRCHTASHDIRSYRAPKAKAKLTLLLNQHNLLLPTPSSEQSQTNHGAFQVSRHFKARSELIIFHHSAPKPSNGKVGQLSSSKRQNRLGFAKENRYNHGDEINDEQHEAARAVFTLHAEYIVYCVVIVNEMRRLGIGPPVDLHAQSDQESANEEGPELGLVSQRSFLTSSLSLL